MRIDAHQHFWSLARGDYGWLTPALGPIHRDFGPADLAASMGLLGQQTHPDVVAAVLRVIEAGNAAGTPVGVNAFDPDAADRYAEAGAAYVLVGADVTLLARASEALAARFIGDLGSDSAPAVY